MVGMAASVSRCPTCVVACPSTWGVVTPWVSGAASRHTRCTIAELPTHTHALRANAAVPNSSPPTPQGNILADSAPGLAYRSAGNLATMNPLSVTNVGGSQAHLNMEPFLTLSFCIALQGIFPSPN